MKIREVAIIWLLNSKNQILIENRKEFSKYWEQRWFFGGCIKEWEAKEQALERELMEELWITLDNYEYLGIAESDYGFMIVRAYVFVWRIDDDFQIEPSVWEFFELDEVYDLPGWKGDRKIIDMIKAHLYQ